MPGTVTTTLGGTLPADDGVGSKVPLYNSYLMNALEPTLRGINAKNLSATTSAVTLTATEARNVRHVFTNAGAAIDIKMPLATTSTFFVVKNSSGFTLTIKTDAGSSTGVPVPNGTIQPLWINGDNVEKAGPPSVAAGAAASIVARVTNSANLSITNVTETDLTFDTERYDTDTIHSTSTNTNRLTLPFAGYWMIGGQVCWANNTTGSRMIIIRKNGTTIIARIFGNATGGADRTEQQVSTQALFAANDYVTLRVYQSSGGALNVEKQADWSPEFWCSYIGS